MHKKEAIWPMQAECKKNIEKKPKVRMHTKKSIE